MTIENSKLFENRLTPETLALSYKLAVDRLFSTIDDLQSVQSTVKPIEVKKINRQYLFDIRSDEAGEPAEIIVTARGYQDHEIITDQSRLVVDLTKQPASEEIETLTAQVLFAISILENN